MVGRHDENAGFKILKEYYDGVKEQIRTSEIQRNTALHIACQVGAKDIVKILLTHPDIKTDVRNCEDKDPKDCIARGFEDTIKLELERTQKGKQLLNVLSSGNIYQAKGLLNQELNPNCWKRNQNGEIETPLSLIIKSCLQGITQDNEEVLTKLLEHKDLDFSQIKPIQAIERNPWVKQIIEQAIKERLTDTINRKDLDDVKELVDDNCFMNYTIVTAALRNVNNPIESITNYLNEKFPANTNNIPKGFEGFKEQELTNKTGKISQLERDLKQVREERDRLLSENRLLRTKSLSNKNEKSSRAISSGRKLSNYASARFILLGVCAVDSCLVIEDYPVIGACLAALALVLLVVGCCSLYKANTILSDVESTQLGGLERS
ncbi:ankyrin repeat domain-containing protein [Wolbachia endosymbiont (group A) of Lasioglossum fulvicorne]|uniref:ankyrin repeat domain-containing protein n=1 Tax=Wolbachia endosymbiont (group A) of Lasioglossum fulvicorne TaxID=3066201 RepID=UPI0033418D88